MEKIFLFIILYFFSHQGIAQEMYYAINDTIIGDPTLIKISDVKSVNLTGNINILILTLIG